jgi:acylpyruvate hydrolase
VGRSLYLKVVAGYFLSVDMTARNIQWEAKKKGLPWSINKGFDTFLPVSEFIPKDKIPNPHNVEVWLSVNGEDRQRDSTELFLFDLPRVISDVSKVMMLEEGDMVITGTPKGVGSLVGGDLVRGGLVVNGKEIEEAKMEVKIEDDKEKGGFVYSET